MELSISFKFNESFIKSCDKNNDRGYFLEVDAEYQKKKKKKKKIYLHKYISFLPERKKIEKCDKLVYSIQEKNYVVHIRALKQVLNHGLIFKKLHRVVQFNQEA